MAERLTAGTYKRTFIRLKGARPCSFVAVAASPAHDLCGNSACQMADEAVVQIDEQRCVLAAPVSLSLPLREDPHRGEPAAAVFESRLPDSEPLRRRVTGKVGARCTDAYSLVAAINRDCVAEAHARLADLLDPLFQSGLVGPTGSVSVRLGVEQDFRTGGRTEIAHSDRIVSTSVLVRPDPRTFA